MATLKEIKGRITAVQNTQKITKAMKMVAAAKLRRAQERITMARPYANKINELLNHLVDASTEIVNPLMEERSVSNRLVVVVSSDRGLAGSFNSNLLKFASTYINELGKDTMVMAVGKKANDYFKNRKYNLIKGISDLFSDLRVERSQEIVNELVNGYLGKKFDKVDIIFNEFQSVVRQIPTREQFLPLGSDKLTDEKRDGEEKKANVDYIYEPSIEKILNDLIPRKLATQFWKALLESNAAEQGARMTAMETATRNADELLVNLKLQFNRARQEAITKEILEIVGGAEALKEA
ncbi:MAG: ATP synthase F1 subunit gamma [Ignavibacteriae bacterium]|nr:ATP synthase F1 subunit gamma [Ignavibacteriota bacterium]MCB9244427.1 ATP synthase F1 subunit gamma [Ignavibacteriales bacterium]